MYETYSDSSELSLSTTPTHSTVTTGIRLSTTVHHRHISYPLPGVTLSTSHPVPVSPL